VESLKREDSRVIFMTPQGRRFTQDLAGEYAKPGHLIVICGHYEGVDERVREALADDEISIGDYVLTNGVLSAAVVVDAVVRLLPGVLGGEGATEQESFSDDLLEYPQYTRPAEFRGMCVPEVLRSGDHQAIAEWRLQKSRERTRERRPDLLKDNDN
jgi:tRNA (guanine37-N1)-methyltransferase